MEDKVKESVDYMKAQAPKYNGTWALDGEDGGCLIGELKGLVSEGLLKETTYLDLGIFKYPDEADDHKYLHVFENETYKFLCVDSKEVIVYPGGTCSSGTVELYETPKGEN